MASRLSHLTKAMKRNQHRLRPGFATIMGLSTIVVLIAALGFYVAYQFVGPAPPKRIVLATGEPGGAYHFFGEKFAAYLAGEGIEVELRPTAGSVENLRLLDLEDGADLGFVQGGIANLVAAENVMAIGSLYLEPLWLFVRSDVSIGTFGDLAGKRVAVGAEGSGTRGVVLGLLAENGVDTSSSELLDVSSDKLVRAFADGTIDAAFIIAGPDSEYIVALTGLAEVGLQSLKRADAYVRRYSFLSKVTLPEGVLDLRTNRPDDSIDTVSVTAMLAAKRDLHPALVDLMLVAAADIHGGHTLLSDAGQFPTSRYVDLPLSDEAERHFRYGPPFLMRYLPFWAATLVDRLWIMLLPLIGLAIPLFKLVPPAYQWRIRRRLLRLYSELERLDPANNEIMDDEDVAGRLRSLERLENASAVESVPKAFTENIYKLRRDIDLVRRRVSAAQFQE
jgi:TRAP transporter TAXI family solute receptor